MAMPTSAFQLQCLREQLQVDLVINLTQRDLHRNAIQTLQEGEAPQLLHFPLKDYGFATGRRMERIVYEIKKVVALGKAVAVHCCGGLGRTGVVIACYLVAEHGMAAHEAIHMVRERRPHSLVCQQQELTVYRFATYLDEKAKVQP